MQDVASEKNKMYELRRKINGDEIAYAGRRSVVDERYVRFCIKCLYLI